MCIIHYIALNLHWLTSHTFNLCIDKIFSVIVVIKKNKKHQAAETQYGWATPQSLDSIFMQSNTGLEWGSVYYHQIIYQTEFPLLL